MIYPQQSKRDREQEAADQSSASEASLCWLDNRQMSSQLCNSWVEGRLWVEAKTIRCCERIYFFNSSNQKIGTRDSVGNNINKKVKSWQLAAISKHQWDVTIQVNKKKGIMVSFRAAANVLIIDLCNISVKWKRKSTCHSFKYFTVKFLSKTVQTPKKSHDLKKQETCDICVVADV